MPRLLFLILSLIVTTHLKAQEWFPVGASWYYNQVILLQGESFRYFEVTGEIIIQGKSCKVINGACNCGVPGLGGYIYQEGDRIFSFDVEADSFRLLFDFTLEAGDTLIIRGDPMVGGDGMFLIDSVTTIQFDSQTLRVQHLTILNFDIVWGNKIIERIGSNGCFYPQVSFCDPLTGGLRCYEDDETGLLNFQIPPRPCNYTSVSVDDPSAAPVMKLYPNPARDVVHIDSEQPIERLTVFNCMGIPVHQATSVVSTEVDINLHSIPPGLYCLQAVLGDDRIIHRPIVIQK